MNSSSEIIKPCLIAGIITAFIVCILIFCIPLEQRTLVNIVSISGAFFSLAGVIIALIQLARIHKASDAASSAASEAKADLQKLLSITEFAQVVSIIRKVESFVRYDKYELAIERIIDIKDFLDRIAFLKVPNVDGNAISRCKNKLDLNMSELEQKRVKPTSLNKESFIKDMEELISLLIKADNNIKNI